VTLVRGRVADVPARDGHDAPAEQDVAEQHIPRVDRHAGYQSLLLVPQGTSGQPLGRRLLRPGPALTLRLSVHRNASGGRQDRDKHL
jgi:hypothetical protein